MNISRSEAEDSLAEIERMVARTRRMVVAGHGAGQLILWGFLWMIGFGVSQFMPVTRGLIWMPICAVGGALSWWMAFRGRRMVSGPTSGRIWQLFAVLFGFAVVWAIILHPFNYRHLSVYFATVFMFAYVVMGFWFGKFFTAIGLGITAAALVGIFMFPNWLDLWMAIFGGGSLIATGWHIRRSWK